MKLIGISILLSLALLSSTAYLAIYQNSSKLARLDNQQAHDSCLKLDNDQSGYFYFATNVCQKPLKFSITYFTEGTTTKDEILKTDCFKVDQRQMILIHVYSAIKRIKEQEC